MCGYVGMSTVGFAYWAFTIHMLTTMNSEVKSTLEKFCHLENDILS